MENKGDNTQLPNKSPSVTSSNRENMDKVGEKPKSFTDKIVNKISHIDSVKEIENALDKSSNVKFITFGFIVIIYAILVAVVADTVIQSANVFFVVTIISISTLVGTLVYQIRPPK
jgi:t-SNARE complex subunit (syntaxin)